MQPGSGWLVVLLVIIPFASGLLSLPLSYPLYVDSLLASASNAFRVDRADSSQQTVRRRYMINSHSESYQLCRQINQFEQVIHRSCHSRESTGCPPSTDSITFPCCLVNAL